MLGQRSKAYSNPKSQPEVDVDEERQALLEDQRVIRLRAHKLSLETNRRRRALEEKQREEEQREQKFREDVLQQRKLKLQEATEKFQRAHLPPSQRRRPAYTVHKRPTPKLEDALEQIQGSVPPAYYYLSSHRSPSSTRTTDAPPSHSTIGHSTWPRKQQPAAKFDLERLFQDRTAVPVDSGQLYFQHRLEEAQRLLEEQHLSNLQNFHQEVEQLAHEDSVSSLDSLEGNLETVKEEDSSGFPPDPLHKALAEISSPSLNRGYHNTDGGVIGLNSHTSLPEPFQPAPEEMTVEKRSPLGCEESFPHSGLKIVDTLTRNGKIHPTSTYNASISNLDMSPVPRVSMAENKLSYYDRDNASCNVVVRPSKAWATPDPTPEKTIQVSRDYKDTAQHPGLSTKPTMSQLLATPVVVPFTEASGSSQYSVSTDLKPSKHPDKIHSTSSVPDPEILKNTYNIQFHTMKNGPSKPAEIDSRESPPHQKRLSPTQSSKIDSGLIQDPKSHQNGTTIPLDDPDLALSTIYRMARISSAGKEGKKLLKSILKKSSKYENGYARAMGIGKMILMGDRGSVGIRDSVELVKEKEHKKTNNKKLRWLDEMEKIMDDRDVAGINGTIKKSPVETQNDQAHTTPGPTPGTPSSVFSTGYHFTKQAWMVEETKPMGHVHPVRSPPKAKTRVVRRPKSARTPSVVHRNRKGIIIRPQSATEASKIARSQGKIMTPHPPPRPTSDNNGNRELMTKAKTQPGTANVSQGSNTNNGVSSTNHAISRDNVVYQIIPHAVTNLQTTPTYVPSDVDNATKAALTLNSERLLAMQENVTVPSKRQPVYGENGLRLDHTPTDEEIALLWQGVRSALAHKNAATGYVTLARRKQILDSSENKRRALLEQRKGRPVSAGWRPAHSQNMNTMKINPLLSAHEPGHNHSATHAGEVSESTAQFMLAENLVETSASDGEILAAMKEVQANRQSAAIQRTPHTALSIEEQKLLQSLDRLNQRLQNVQETMMKPSAATNGFQPKSALKVHQIPPQPAEHMTQTQKYRSLSADPRTRLQRRY
ncbi:centrosomal protein of 126 kDa isoform X2 [Dendropsophus ebraccatus]|uniref:centrosomal protein of 126 kDa isoform X2 n=1 Tax=Dendropsophus ebraccatus TaxID=150705 RepID=UPI003831BA68